MNSVRKCDLPQPFILDVSSHINTQRNTCNTVDMVEISPSSWNVLQLRWYTEKVMDEVEFGKKKHTHSVVMILWCTSSRMCASVKYKHHRQYTAMCNV